MTTHLDALGALEASPRADPAALLALFDRLPAASLKGMRGRWRGSGFRSGHPMDGLLGAFGWYGKEFVDLETVHPLLFGRAGATWAVDPARMPMAIALWPGLPRWAGFRFVFQLFRPVLQTRLPRARLRLVEHRGVPTATMIYDAHPIADSFREVDADTRLGIMDFRGMGETFFFVLRRE